MKIVIETIPHSKQRYDTCGDWFRDKNDVLQIRVSDVDDEGMELAVALHELVEASLCEARGLTFKEVDDFDMHFTGDGEPGDNPKAPYYDEHGFATNLEFLFLRELDVDRTEYVRRINKLTAERKR